MLIPIPAPPEHSIDHCWRPPAHRRPAGGLEQAGTLAAIGPRRPGLKALPAANHLISQGTGSQRKVQRQPARPPLALHPRLSDARLSLHHASQRATAGAAAAARYVLARLQDCAAARRLRSCSVGRRRRRPPTARTQQQSSGGLALTLAMPAVLSPTFFSRWRCHFGVHLPAPVAFLLVGRCLLCRFF